MARYAIIQTGGKQYQVQVGDQILVEKLPQQPGVRLSLETLLVGEDGQIQVGRPSLGEKVAAEVVEETKGEKIISFKFKRRKGYSRKIGHRQPLTRLKIMEIQ